MMNERKKSLEALLAFEQPLEQHRTELAAFSWDADTELAFLSLSHIANVLTRFVADSMVATEVEAWANAIEGRDDIGFESANEQQLRELLHELANPLLTQSLTRERAVELLKKIEPTVQRRSV
jgi:hypothetical protein